MTKSLGWYTAQELAGLPGMPKTTRAIQIRAKADWQGRKRDGSKAVEYPIAIFPAETQAALLEKAVSAPVEVSTSVAQIEGEQSPSVGTAGLNDKQRQVFPKALGKVEPFNPIWSMQALVSYDRWLADRITARNTCEQGALMLSAYNGGLGWVIRDRKLASAKGADPLTWFDSVERQNAGRSAAAFRENRQYPRLILMRWEALYVADGWGQGVCQ